MSEPHSPKGYAVDRNSRKLSEENDLLNDDFEETSYSATLAITVMDLNKMSQGSYSVSVGTRITRIMLSLLMLWILISIQVFLLVNIKTFVTSPAVRKIRQNYNKFQHLMYQGHVVDSGYGFALGEGGPNGPYYKREMFEYLSKEDKKTICQIPFSQWKYLGIVLTIWSLTIIGEIKSAVNQMFWVFSVPNLPLDRAIVEGDSESTIIGMPAYIKAVIIIFLVVPRLLIASVLCWLGCRWLSSTLNFAEVLINGVALEFIITLNELLYDKLISARNKRELQSLKMELPAGTFDKPSAFSYLSTFGWGIFGVTWVYLYLTKLQMVLPGYQWDVRPVCQAWIEERYDFWRI